MDSCTEWPPAAIPSFNQNWVLWGRSRASYEIGSALVTPPRSGSTPVVSFQNQVEGDEHATLIGHGEKIGHKRPSYSTMPALLTTKQTYIAAGTYRAPTNEGCCTTATHAKHEGASCVLNADEEVCVRDSVTMMHHAHHAKRNIL